nr:hypothetical protein [Tanacetum cinerariifolium]
HVVGLAGYHAGVVLGLVRAQHPKQALAGQRLYALAIAAELAHGQQALHKVQLGIRGRYHEAPLLQAGQQRVHILRCDVHQHGGRRAFAKGELGVGGAQALAALQAKALLVEALQVPVEVRVGAGTGSRRRPGRYRRHRAGGCKLGVWLRRWQSPPGPEAGPGQRREEAHEARDRFCWHGNRRRGQDARAHAALPTLLALHRAV